MAELNKGIRREMTRLSERWPALLHHTDMWQAKLDDMLPVISASPNTMRRFSIKDAQYETFNLIGDTHLPFKAT